MIWLLTTILFLSLFGISVLALNLFRIKKALAASEYELIRKSDELNKRISDLVESSHELESENKKLLKIQSVQQEHIDNLKNALKPDSFDGFFPICSNCKDIRDPKGFPAFHRC
jgi:FtsZ-binding cell division protein ZapB